MDDFLVIESVEQLENLIKEEISKIPVYLASVLIETDRNENLTDILTEIRAIEGVTIVTLDSPSHPITAYKERTYISLKFIPVGNFNRPLNFLKEMRTRIMETRGVHTFSVKHLQVIRTIEANN